MSQQTAAERGIEMLLIPVGKLPPLALDFLEFLSEKVGMCIEVCLTAYTVYAQCVENLECNDKLYKAKVEDIAWFKERLAAKEKDNIAQSSGLIISQFLLFMQNKSVCPCHIFIGDDPQKLTPDEVMLLKKEFKDMVIKTT